MATFKAIVFKHYTRADKTYNIKIRATHKQKSKYVPTNWTIGKDDVTKSFKIKNQGIIDETEVLISNYRKICNDHAWQLDKMDVSQIVSLVTETDKTDTFSIDLIAYGRSQMEVLKKEGRMGSLRVMASALNNFIKFIGKEEFDINDLTAKFIKDWLAWIDKSRAKSLYASCIRKLHNDAKKEFNVEELGIIKIPLSPFSVAKVPKIPKAKERDIPIEKVREIFKLEDTNNHLQQLARDMFMLSFCLWGTNAKDLYECTDFKNGRITYYRAKTKSRRDDKAKISIKIEPEIIPLIEKYRDKTGKRAFNFYQLYSSAETFNTAIGKGTRRLREVVDVDYLIYYSARHSFASIAINDVDINEILIHKMLNHVIEEMKVTEMYVRKSWNPMDRANRKLLDFVFEK